MRKSATEWSSVRIAPGSGLINEAINERTGASVLSFLNRARTTLVSADLL
jgi:hypothetical protein